MHYVNALPPGLTRLGGAQCLPAQVLLPQPRDPTCFPSLCLTATQRCHRPKEPTEPVQYCEVAFNMEYKSRKTVAAKEVGWDSDHILVPVLEDGRARGSEQWLDLPCPPETEQAEATNARKPMKGQVQEVGKVGSTGTGSLRGQAVEASLTPQSCPPAGGPGPGPRLHAPWQPGRPPAP